MRIYKSEPVLLFHVLLPDGPWAQVCEIRSEEFGGFPKSLRTMPFCHTFLVHHP